MKTQPRQHISNKYNTCTVVTSPVYIGSKVEISREIISTAILFLIPPIQVQHSISAKRMQKAAVLWTCNWATTWQNQQSECATSEDPDQPEHPPSLIRVLAVCLMGS